MSEILHPHSWKGVLMLCYAAVRAAALARGKYDPEAMATLAEAIAKRIEEYLGGDPHRVIEITPMDVENYEYICDIFDNLQQTLPLVMSHFNVRLNIQRFDYLERTHAATATHGHQGGKA